MELIKLDKEVKDYCQTIYPKCGACGLRLLCQAVIPITYHHINENTANLNELAKRELINSIPLD